jgi:preprotein translocase subunit SecB
MSKAAFSIVSYQFNKVSLNYTNFSIEEMQVAFMPTGSYAEDASEYELQFVTAVFSKENIDNPFLSINCIANFKFETATGLQDIPDFFYTNAIAILFPYVRAYASLITTQANVQGIILPTLNLSHLGEDLKKNTTKK